MDNDGKILDVHICVRKPHWFTTSEWLSVFWTICKPPVTFKSLLCLCLLIYLLQYLLYEYDNIWQQLPSRNKQRGHIVLLQKIGTFSSWLCCLGAVKSLLCPAHFNFAFGSQFLDRWPFHRSYSAWKLRCFRAFLFSFVWQQVCGLISMLGGKLCLDVVFFEHNCALKTCQDLRGKRIMTFKVKFVCFKHANSCLCLHNS